MSGKCPRCGFAGEAPDAECAQCGVVFAKLRPPSDPDDAPVTPPDSFEITDPREERRQAYRSTCIGLALAAGVMLVPYLRFIFGYLGTLLHEFGHAACAWSFGYPAVPAFNFVHGGGVTSVEERKILLVILIYAGLGSLIYRYRRHTPGLVAFAVFAGVYSFAAFSRIHELLIDFMGHGAVLIFGGVFLYRALSGAAVQIPVERPLYAFVAFFLIFDEMRLAIGLATSHERRVEYELALNGIPGDFTKIAASLAGLELATVAGFYLLLCPLPLVLAWLYLRHREPALQALSRVIVRPRRSWA